MTRVQCKVRNIKDSRNKEAETEKNYLDNHSAMLSANSLAIVTPCVNLSTVSKRTKVLMVI
jgi:hypothetical protein